MKIGFIGLGIMGSRIFLDLGEKGFDLVVHNRTKEKADNVIAKGAAWADSPAAVAGEVDILFTMLSTPEAVYEMAMGTKGFFDALRPQTLWVDCSTVHPSFARSMAELSKEKGIRKLDAPVAGSKVQAEQRKLVFLIGGEASDMEECRSCFAAMGQNAFYMGGHGMGAAMKMVINLLLGESMLAFSEALVLGESLGIKRSALFDTLLGTPVAAPFMAAKRAKIEEGQFEADFPLKWMQKDFHLVALTAYEAGVALPGANLAKELTGWPCATGLQTRILQPFINF